MISYEDLKGKRFGKLVVLDRVDSKWKCICDCGNITFANASNLKSGNTKSCGCLTKTKDLTNMRFGRLVAIKRITPDGSKRPIWLCKCDCGNQCKVGGYDLRVGHTRSCGCLLRDRMKFLNRKHGLSNTRLYDTWIHMKRRCYDETNSHYKSYGARGIKICDEWLNDKDGFVNFYNWAMSNGYKEDLTIERIDVNGDYCPENCEWIPSYLQSLNRQTSLRTKDGYSVGRICYDRNLDYNKILECLRKLNFNATKNELIDEYLHTFPPIKTK